MRSQRARDDQAAAQNIEGETSTRHRRTAETNRGDRYSLAIGGCLHGEHSTKQKEQYEGDEPARGRPLLLYFGLGVFVPLLAWAFLAWAILAWAFYAYTGLGRCFDISLGCSRTRA